MITPCDWSEDSVVACQKRSRFTVVRADHDRTWGPAEACEDHLPDAVAGMAEGRDIPLEVRVRWDAPEELT